jgi:hypothetical protein
MPRRSLLLVERLRHGLASAAISAAALAVPSAEAATPPGLQLAQSQGGTSRPAARGKATKPSKPTVKPSSPPAKEKPSGCGAHEGGCGASH